jgi:hypothetical protein
MQTIFQKQVGEKDKKFPGLHFKIFLTSKHFTEKYL